MKLRLRNVRTGLVRRKRGLRNMVMSKENILIFSIKKYEKDVEKLLNIK
jgi:hypothetical protein